MSSYKVPEWIAQFKLVGDDADTAYVEFVISNSILGENPVTAKMVDGVLTVQTEIPTAYMPSGATITATVYDKDGNELQVIQDNSQTEGDYLEITLTGANPKGSSKVALTAYKDADLTEAYETEVSDDDNLSFKASAGDKVYIKYAGADVLKVEITADYGASSAPAAGTTAIKTTLSADGTYSTAVYTVPAGYTASSATAISVNGAVTATSGVKVVGQNFTYSDNRYDEEIDDDGNGGYVLPGATVYLKAENEVYFTVQAGATATAEQIGGDSYNGTSTTNTYTIPADAKVGDTYTFATLDAKISIYSAEENTTEAVLASNGKNGEAIAESAPTSEPVSANLNINSKIILRTADKSGTIQGTWAIWDSEAWNGGSPAASAKALISDIAIAGYNTAKQAYSETVDLTGITSDSLVIVFTEAAYVKVTIDNAGGTHIDGMKVDGTAITTGSKVYLDSTGAATVTLDVQSNYVPYVDGTPTLAPVNSSATASAKISGDATSGYSLVLTGIGFDEGNAVNLKDQSQDKAMLAAAVDYLGSMKAGEVTITKCSEAAITTGLKDVIAELQTILRTETGCSTLTLTDSGSTFSNSIAQGAKVVNGADDNTVTVKVTCGTETNTTTVKSGAVVYQNLYETETALKAAVEAALKGVCATDTMTASDYLAALETAAEEIAGVSEFTAKPEGNLTWGENLSFTVNYTYTGAYGDPAESSAVTGSMYASVVKGLTEADTTGATDTVTVTGFTPAVAQVWTITVTTPPTTQSGDGSVTVTLCGTDYTVAIGTSTTAADFADALYSEIKGEDEDGDVTVTDTTNNVVYTVGHTSQDAAITLTAKTAGAITSGDVAAGDLTPTPDEETTLNTGTPASISVAQTTAGTDAVKASASLDVSGITFDGTGTVEVELFGKTYTVAVTSSMTAAEFATALVAAINADKPTDSGAGDFTATVSGTTITLTATKDAGITDTTTFTDGNYTVTVA